jgi:FkbM family methyltransferase
MTSEIKMVKRFKRLAKKIVPFFIIKIIIKKKHRLLINEIKLLEVIERGEVEKYNWVKLSCGTKFIGLKPNQKQVLIFKIFSKELVDFEKDDLAILIEIVSRYKFPRNIPGASGHIPLKYNPLRDPLNDFDLEYDERERLIHIFKPKLGDVFVDIGAYMGYGTLKAAQLIGSKGIVFAFEADKQNFEILKLNIEENNLNNVILLPYAAGSINGDQKFYKTKATAHSLSVSTLELLGRENITYEIVKTRRVEDVLKQYGHNAIDYLSITVNGHEHEVLLGMTRIISKSTRIRITLAGWYLVNEVDKVADLAMPILKEMHLHQIRGKLGRVLGWVD